MSSWQWIENRQYYLSEIIKIKNKQHSNDANVPEFRYVPLLQ